MKSLICVGNADSLWFPVYFYFYTELRLVENLDHVCLHRQFHTKLIDKHLSNEGNHRNSDSNLSSVIPSPVKHHSTFHLVGRSNTQR